MEGFLGYSNSFMDLVLVEERKLFLGDHLGEDRFDTKGIVLEMIL